MSKLIDMTGWIMSEHGVPDSRLRVIERAEDYITPNGCVKAQWICECMCGNHARITTTGQRIRRGETKSCGCLAIEVATAKIKKVQPMTVALTKKYNEYDLSGSYGVGVFSNCDDIFLFDLDDYDKIKDYCWHKSNGYAYTYMKNKVDETNMYISMHDLLGFKYGDHKNRNRADNRKENLRNATRQENARNTSLSSKNTSGYKGVSWKKDKKKWKAYITIGHKQIHLGYFDNKDDAVKARLEAEREYFGDFSAQQDIFMQYGINSICI
jgi:hypothetical protein